MSRRLKEAGELQSACIKIHITPDEKRQLEEKAQAARLPVSTWIRQIALAPPPQECRCYRMF